MARRVLATPRHYLFMRRTGLASRSAALRATVAWAVGWM
jgi:hypothetical protein